MKTIKENEYKCASCGEIFEKDWSDEEALEERNEVFGNVPDSECDLVCDDCYRKIMNPDIDFDKLFNPIRGITHNNITELKQNEIFVFGSNTSGRHGAGAAKTAMKWGAKYGIGEGLCNQTYALPTVNGGNMKTLSIDKIKIHVDRFIECAKKYDVYTFLVTEIGCGLAGHNVKAIAPLFKECIKLKNVYLPKKFWQKLKKYM